MRNLNSGFTRNNWGLRMFVNNVTDELAILDVDNTPDGCDAFTVRPQTFGAHLTWRFK